MNGKKRKLVFVLPTADRRLFTERAVWYFDRSIVRNNPAYQCDLVIVDAGRWELAPEITRARRVIRCAPGTPIGTMRNIGVESYPEAWGVFDLDSDDWYSPSWFALALTALETSKAGFVGCPKHSTYDMLRKRAWPAQVCQARHVASGATFGFLRSLWKISPFPDLSDGEDHEFLRGCERVTGEHMTDVDGAEHFVYIRHAGNVTGNFAEGRIDVDHSRTVRAFMGSDVEWYDAISEMLNGGNFNVRRRDWHLPTDARTVAGRR